MTKAKAVLQRLVRFALGGLFAFALVSSWSAVAQDKGAKFVAKGETVRIHEYPGTIAVGQEVLWVAVDKGFCSAHGLKCELVKIANGSLGLQALTAGSIEVNFVTTDLMVQAAVRGIDLQIIAGTHPNLYLTLAARKDVPLPNRAKGYPAIMRDLKGRKVGVAARGAATEIQTRALLAGAGMDASDVTFVAVGAPGSAYSAFAAGTIDVAMSWPPFFEICEASDTCVPVVHTAIEGPAELRALNGAVQGLGALRSYINANPTVIRAFVQAIQESAAWIRSPANFEEFVTLTKARFTLGTIPNADAVLRNILQNEQKNVGATIDPKALQATSDYLHRYKVIEKPFDTTNLLYRYAPRP